MMERKKTIDNSIERILWMTFDTLRGEIEINSYFFKEYFLSLYFLKFVTVVWRERQAFYMNKYDGDETRVERVMRYEWFQVPENASFDYVYSNHRSADIGDIINQTFSRLVKANPVVLEDVFNYLDFNNEKMLGTHPNRLRILSNLIVDLSRLDFKPLLSQPEIIGNITEWLFQKLIELDGKAGPSYVPQELAELIATLVAPYPGSRIYDPVCGIGSLFLETAKKVKNSNFSLYGQEANNSTMALARMNMILHQIDKADIKSGDVLGQPGFTEDDQLMKFDIVLANPPFSMSWNVEDAMVDQYKRFHRGVPPKSRADYAFISHIVESMKEETGRGAVIVPHGVLFRGSTEGEIRKKLIDENLLEAVIGLPAGLFHNTGIPVAVIIFNKGKEHDNKDVLFIDASNKYQANKGRNTIRDQDINDIVTVYESFKATDPLKTKKGKPINQFAYRATIEEIQENDYNLNIPRYVNTIEQLGPLDFYLIQHEIDTLKSGIAAIEVKVQESLKELGF